MLCYQAPNLCLVGYSDAIWGGDTDERKSTSGYAFLLNDRTIIWCNKKKTYAALSTLKVEYIAGSTAVQEGVWLRRFIRELEIIARAEELVTIYCNNSATIAYFKDLLIMEKPNT